MKTGCEVPSAKSLTAKCAVNHFEACVCLIRPPRGTMGDRFWCLPLFSSIQRQQTDYRFPEEGNSFHSSKQAKQTLPKVWSPQGSEGHCTRCSFHCPDQRCHTDSQQMKTHFWPGSEWTLSMESRKDWLNPSDQWAIFAYIWHCIYTYQAELS